MSFFSSLRASLVKKTERNGKSPLSELLNVYINNSGTKVVITRLDGSIQVWRVNSHSLGDCVTIENPQGRKIIHVSWHTTTESHFATVAGDTNIKMWSPMGRLEKEVVTTEACSLCQYSADGMFLAVVTELNNVHMYDVSKKYACVASFRAEASVNDLKWSNQGHPIFVLALNDGTAQLISWDGYSLNATHKLPCGPSAKCILFDVQGKYIAVGSENGAVYFWRSSDLVCFKVLPNTGLEICGLSTDRDGGYICVSYVGQTSSKVFHSESLEQVYDINDLRSDSQISLVAWYPSKTMMIYANERGRAIGFTKREGQEDRDRTDGDRKDDKKYEKRDERKQNERKQNERKQSDRRGDRKY